MSGVVDQNGQQWERCHTCFKFVRFPQMLGYTAEYKLHICIDCANKREDVHTIIPAPDWVAINQE